MFIATAKKQRLRPTKPLINWLPSSSLSNISWPPYTNNSWPALHYNLKKWWAISDWTCTVLVEEGASPATKAMTWWWVCVSSCVSFRCRKIRTHMDSKSGLTNRNRHSQTFSTQPKSSKFPTKQTTRSMYWWVNGVTSKEEAAQHFCAWKVDNVRNNSVHASSTQLTTPEWIRKVLAWGRK